MDTQPTSLNCPACGAPLDVDGTQAVVRCKFCGNTSVLPGFLSGQSAAPAASLEQIRKLASSGEFAGAVAKFGQLYGGDPEQIRHAIEAIQAGRLVTPSAQGRQGPEELTKALQEVQLRLSTGDKIGAIKVYREHFDTSLARAKYAVEQIEAGQTLHPEMGFPTPAPTVSKSSVSFEASRAKRAGALGGLIVVAIIVLFVGGIIALILFVPGGALNPRYFSYGPAAILPSESSAPPDVALGLFNPDKDARYLGLVDGAAGKLRWHAEALSGDGYLDAIASGPDLVYAANGSELVAYRLSDGSQTWQVQMPDKLNYGPSELLVTAGRVITTNSDQTIQAYEAETGELVWSKRLNGYDRTLRLVGNALVVVDYTGSASQYNLEFLDPATGALQQQFTPTCTHNDYPTNIDPGAGLVYDLAQNALYMVYDSSYGCVQRLDLASGQTAWEADSQDSFNISSDGLHYLMTPSTFYFSNGNDLLAVDKASGEMHVLLTNPDYELLPLAMAGDTLIVRARRTRGTERFELWGVDLTGNQVWQVDLQDSSPVDPPDEMAGLIDDTGSGWTWQLATTGLVVVTFQAKPNQAVLETFNPANGTSLSKQAVALKNVSGDFYSVPNVIGRRGNLVYLQLETNLYTLDVTTGELQRVY